MTTSALELTANTLMTASIVLAGRNSSHTWWTGIIGCALFAAVFADARLYADVVLQFFFIATSAIGWRQWQAGRNGHELPLTRAPRRTVIGCVAVGIAAALAYGAMLALLTDAYAPFVDSSVLSFSVMAQLLLMTRRIETWPFWLAVNTIAVPLFAFRGLHLTALLYAVYWFNAVIAWRHWRALMRSNESAAPQPA
jgi:nicotinamide mononucleotide transporter